MAKTSENNDSFDKKLVKAQLENKKYKNQEYETRLNKAILAKADLIDLAKKAGVYIVLERAAKTLGGQACFNFHYPDGKIFHKDPEGEKIFSGDQDPRLADSARFLLYWNRSSDGNYRYFYEYVCFEMTAQGNFYQYYYDELGNFCSDSGFTFFKRGKPTITSDQWRSDQSTIEDWVIKAIVNAKKGRHSSNPKDSNKKIY